MEGTTGLFFRQPTTESLMQALSAIRDVPFIPAALQAHANRYDLSVFDERIQQFLQEALIAHRSAYGLDPCEKGQSFSEDHPSLRPPLHFAPGKRTPS